MIIAFSSLHARNKICNFIISNGFSLDIKFKKREKNRFEMTIYLLALAINYSGNFDKS